MRTVLVTREWARNLSYQLLKGTVQEAAAWLDQGWYFARAKHRLKRALAAAPAGPPLVLLTMGKVGSSSMWASLQASDLQQRMPLLRGQRISDQGVAYLRSIHLAGCGGA